ncbi:4-carboxy-2-hydroxymuconate-6-semialdehyde dehydrogenase [Symmachiella dynata]|uniref:Gfo/Idh/MocA family protein n=1 Tax=Symmachiella dynata TaxID=2527995 RepID=UPI001188B160|nr:Gfo/Idh/MocA family oxidoreductase [Symmachiella dynata]QDT46821.1 4-carboxy-2-hydroxymuconate-6-semialdehyde dehydrogenase [Symmachiella dynata]
MVEDTVRVAIVGAGANTRLRHIPGFREIDGVEIVGVVNQTQESTARAAEELSIPKQYPDWQALVSDDDVDAVMIGTCPNLHCEISCAALEAGKHVLTEARMARNASEAHAMLKAAQAHPDLVAQIVPSPFGLEHESRMRQLIEDGFIGDLREMVVVGAADAFWDYTKPLHWRQDAEISGYNTLTLGIMHETAMRWTSPTTRVFAQATTFEPKRPSKVGTDILDVTVPDSLQVLTELSDGARGLYHFSGIDLFGPGHQIHLYGTRGTIKAKFNDGEQIFVGHAGDDDMTLLRVPKEQLGGWRVEAEFIGAIRGTEPVRLTDFESGVRYMEFTEAVHRSIQTNAPVNLPLA